MIGAQDGPPRFHLQQQGMSLLQDLALIERLDRGQKVVVVTHEHGEQREILRRERADPLGRGGGVLGAASPAGQSKNRRYRQLHPRMLRFAAELHHLLGSIPLRNLLQCLGVTAFQSEIKNAQLFLPQHCQLLGALGAQAVGRGIGTHTSEGGEGLDQRVQDERQSLLRVDQRVAVCQEHTPDHVPVARRD